MYIFIVSQYPLDTYELEGFLTKKLFLDPFYVFLSRYVKILKAKFACCSAFQTPPTFETFLPVKKALPLFSMVSLLPYSGIGMNAPNDER